MRTTNESSATKSEPIAFIVELRAERWNGKCKGCRKAHTALVIGQIRKGFEVTGISEGGGLVDSLSGRYVVACDCGKAVRLERVRGRYNAAKECNARCMSATGHDCECACGGKNHGAGACAH